jgi:hypothetical protein
MTILDEMQNLFIGEIIKKNSWGKNEIISLWKDCLLQILKQKIEKH